MKRKILDIEHIYKMETQAWTSGGTMEDLKVPTYQNKNIVGANFRVKFGTWTQGSTTGAMSDADEGIARIINEIVLTGSDGVPIAKIRGKDIPYIFHRQYGKDFTHTNPTVTASATSTPVLEFSVKCNIPVAKQPILYKLVWGTIQDVDGTGYSGSSLATTVMYPTFWYGNGENRTDYILYDDYTTKAGANIRRILKHGSLVDVVTLNTLDTIVTDFILASAGRNLITNHYLDLVATMKGQLVDGTRYTGEMSYDFEEFVADDSSRFEFTDTSATAMRFILFYKDGGMATFGTPSPAIEKRRVYARRGFAPRHFLRRR